MRNVFRRRGSGGQIFRVAEGGRAFWRVLFRGAIFYFLWPRLGFGDGQRPAPLDEQALEDLGEARAQPRICRPAALDEHLQGCWEAGRKGEALTLDAHREYHLHGGGSIPGHLAGDHFP